MTLKSINRLKNLRGGKNISHRLTAFNIFHGIWVPGPFSRFVESVQYIDDGCADDHRSTETLAKGRD